MKSSDSSVEESAAAEIESNESRNMLVLAIHQILLRTAWVFKTESVIMPAFMDQISGAGWLRGCLPVLNRIGQSLPPLLVAERLKNAGHKKWTLMAASVGMALPFLILSGLWFAIDDKRSLWLPVVFLGLYLVFFSAVGVNNLAYGTLQGKLVRADRRGRLMSLSGMIGSVFAVTALLFVLSGWLARPDGGFGLIFGVAGLGFVLGGVCVCFIIEPPDVPARTRWVVIDRFRDAHEIFWGPDSRFRRIAIVAMCFCPIMILFPHYQSLGRSGSSIQDSATNLMVWVIAQNVAIGVYSMIAGSLADRFGNRLVLSLELLCSALTPLTALALWQLKDKTGIDVFWITFAMVGIAPVTMRTITNFTLELIDPKNHPRYVSTMSLCMAIPFLTSPLVGYGVDVLGFVPIFLGSSLVMATGFALSFRMPEPRRDS